MFRDVAFYAKDGLNDPIYLFTERVEFIEDAETVQEAAEDLLDEIIDQIHLGVMSFTDLDFFVTDGKYALDDFEIIPLPETQLTFAD
jgi:hypothetical protein